MKKRTNVKKQKLDRLAERIKHLQALYTALRREYYTTIGERIDAIIDTANLDEIRSEVYKIRAKYFQEVDDKQVEQKEEKKEEKHE